MFTRKNKRTKICEIIQGLLLTSAIILLLDTTQGDKEVTITGTFCPTFVSVPQLNFNTFTNNLVGTVPKENCFL